MDNMSENPRTGSIPPSYLKKKEKKYKEPSSGIMTILFRNLAFCEFKELRAKYCEEILSRIEVWNDLDPRVREIIKPEISTFLNGMTVPDKSNAPNMQGIVEKILNLATKAEYELGIMVNVEIKDESEATEYDSLLKLLDYCRGKINMVVNTGGIFRESEIPTRREPVTD